MRYEKAVAARDKILGEATRLMLSRQYAELAMADVAAAVPTAKPTLYRYFATKDELRRAVLVAIESELIAAVRDAEKYASTAYDKLFAITTAVLLFFVERPRLLSLLQQPDETTVATGGPWYEARAQLYPRLRGLLAEGAATGEFKVVNFKMATYLLVGGLLAYLQDTGADTSDAAVRTYTASLVQAVTTMTFA
jgi:AcrR family transcriptional regulator